MGAIGPDRTSQLHSNEPRVTVTVVGHTAVELACAARSHGLAPAMLLQQFVEDDLDVLELGAIDVKRRMRTCEILHDVRTAVRKDHQRTNE